MTAVSESQPENTDVWTVSRVLDASIGYLKQHGSDSPRLDAELLLAHSCGCERIQLYTNYNRPLTDNQRATMRAVIQRRAQSEPVAYLVGYREFFSLEFEVNKAVLIPRPDTETLVREALDVLSEMSEPTVLDVGTGSGCIAVAIASQSSSANVTAVDLSPEAIEVAQRNAERHVPSRVRFLTGDLFAPVGQEVFDVVVSNPPYITDAEFPGLDADVRDHEPRAALTSGADGLETMRRLVSDAPKHLRTSGFLMVEIDAAQSETVQRLFADAGLRDIKAIKDLSGLERVICGQK